MASACFCCSHRDEESLDHIFATGAKGGWCKLNTDGSFMGQQCSGGGVLRDCLGNLILAVFQVGGE